MKKAEIRICPICHKVFTNKPHREITTTCSTACGAVFGKLCPQTQKLLLQRAESKKRKPRIDCDMYDPDEDNCTGLTGLWCAYEKCKFYVPKGD